MRGRRSRRSRRSGRASRPAPSSIRAQDPGVGDHAGPEPLRSGEREEAVLRLEAAQCRALVPAVVAGAGVRVLPVERDHLTDESVQRPPLEVHRGPPGERLHPHQTPIPHPPGRVRHRGFPPGCRGDLANGEDRGRRHADLDRLTVGHRIRRRGAAAGVSGRVHIRCHARRRGTVDLLESVDVVDGDRVERNHMRAGRIGAGRARSEQRCGERQDGTCCGKLVNSLHHASRQDRGGFLNPHRGMWIDRSRTRVSATPSCVPGEAATEATTTNRASRPPRRSAASAAGRCRCPAARRPPRPAAWPRS